MTKTSLVMGAAIFCMTITTYAAQPASPNTEQTKALEQAIANNPSLKDKISDFKAFESAAAPEKALVSVNNSCGLVWSHDDGAYGVMRAIRSTTVNVNNVRNGVLVSGGVFNLNKNDTLRLLQNRDGLNYDGYNC